MRIGVDVGGTNTDAVLLRGSEIVSWCKTHTTSDISSGVVNAIAHLLQDAKIPAASIQNVMIGTTQFTNAFVERRSLLEVGIMRLASPSGHAVRPKIGWPDDLSQAVGEHSYLLPGGYQFDGREISPFCPQKTRDAARDLASKNIKAVAISSAFAPINGEMEQQAAAIVRDEIADADITLSSDIGGLGLLERENSAIMNASLSRLSKHVVDSFRRALRELYINCPFYISQNDGTLMTPEFVQKFPIFTFASGPTNSMRGAAFLTGVKDAIVLDIGGTTCDVGVLQQGMPRESSFEVDIGGVRTNFRMPDVLAIGLGGGSVIRLNEEGYRIGPDSVGYRISKEALLFGGDTLTATDIAVADNPSLAVGNPELVKSIPADLVAALIAKMHQLCESALDRMKTAAGDVPVILVGGGHILLSRPLIGCSKLHRPEYAQVANAIGAAIAQVGAEIDHIYSYREMGRESALEDVKKRLADRIEAAGGVPDTIEIINIEEVAIAYLPGESVRVRAKAVADLDTGSQGQPREYAGVN